MKAIEIYKKSLGYITIYIRNLTRIVLDNIKA